MLSASIPFWNWQGCPHFCWRFPASAGFSIVCGLFSTSSKTPCGYVCASTRQCSGGTFPYLPACSSSPSQPHSYWASTCMAALPTYSAFMISVRQASDLPPASFRFPVTWDTLALGYILPAVGRIRDFHPLKHAPAGRTIEKTASFSRSGYLVLALPIFPASHPASIVGADELNFCVRDGNRWTLVAINTNLCRLHKAAVMSKAEAFNLWCAFRDSNPGPTD